MESEDEDAAYQLCLKAAAAIDARQYDLALQFGQEAIEIDPYLDNGYAALGQVFFRLNKYEDARSVFLEGLEKKPDSEPLLRGLAIAYCELEKSEEALELIDRCLLIDPDNSRAFYHRGVALERLDRMDESTECFLKAIELEPGFSLLYSRLGCHYLRKKMLAPAEELLQQALQLGEHSHSLYLNLGLVLWERDALVEAAASFTTALKINPDSDSAKEWLATVVGEHLKKDGRLASFMKFWILWIPFVWAASLMGKYRVVLTGSVLGIALTLWGYLQLRRWRQYRKCIRELQERDPEILQVYDQIVRNTKSNSQEEFTTGGNF